MEHRINDGSQSPFGEEMWRILVGGLDLSESEKSTISRYYALSIQPTISEADASQLEYIWEKAADNQQLADCLGLIDDMYAPCLAGEELISDDRAFREHLRDRLPLLAEEKRKRENGTLKEIEADHYCLTLMCPDGSGMVMRAVPKHGEFVELDEGQRCPRCHARLTEHRIVFSSHPTRSNLPTTDSSSQIDSP